MVCCAIAFTFVLIFFCVAAPNITVFTANEQSEILAVDRGTTVQFGCNATGIPAPEVTIMGDIKNSTTQPNSTTLEMPVPEKCDTPYNISVTCQAANGKTEIVTSTIMLHVLCDKVFSWKTLYFTLGSLLGTIVLISIIVIIVYRPKGQPVPETRPRTTSNHPETRSISTNTSSANTSSDMRSLPDSSEPQFSDPHPTRDVTHSSRHVVFPNDVHQGLRRQVLPPFIQIVIPEDRSIQMVSESYHSRSVPQLRDDPRLEARTPDRNSFQRRLPSSGRRSGSGSAGTNQLLSVENTSERTTSNSRATETTQGDSSRATTLPSPTRHSPRTQRRTSTSENEVSPLHQRESGVLY
ncbi:uncharacterized protein [Littorina saxatilis]|uniref:uncharacterized protein isoform X2 n=1 Tax=Littorina saxatilis TaxID=31220 RepID=UPI0038B69933